MAIFTVSEIAYLGQDIWFAPQSDGSSGLMTLGFIYLICSVITTFYALALVRVSTGIPLFEMEKLSNESKNLTYGLLAVPVSLFSLSIAVIFSDNP